MTEPVAPATPTEINLHQKSRLLEIAFSDGFRFNYPCEYLRVFATESRVQPLDKPVHDKQRVGISSIEPQGISLLKLDFDDGYSGSYSWSTLYKMGENYDQNWNAYLQRIKDNNLQRGEGRAAGSDSKVTIKLLYFIQLAKLTGKDEEDIAIPESVTNVETLLAWLRKRRADWKAAFADDKVKVTVNKHFAESFTLVEHGDEVAIVPRAD